MSGTATINVNSAGLGLGAYSGTLTVTGGNYASPETLLVNLTVIPPPPTITSITRSGNDVHLVWSTTGGTTNQVQFAPDRPTGFTNLSGDLDIPGAGQQITNFTHQGAVTNGTGGYYRIRLVP